MIALKAETTTSSSPTFGKHEEQLTFAANSRPAAANTTRSVHAGQEESTSTKLPMCYNLLFPQKLRRILSDAESNVAAGWDKVISWLPDGKGFKIHDSKRFAAEIMPRYFGSSKFRTFQRSLNLWEYKTSLVGSSRGVCSHPMFQRDSPELCEGMKRVIRKRKCIKQEAPSEATAARQRQETNTAQHASPLPSPLSSSYHHENRINDNDEAVVLAGLGDRRVQQYAAMQALRELFALTPIIQQGEQQNLMLIPPRNNPAVHHGGGYGTSSTRCGTNSMMSPLEPTSVVRDARKQVIGDNEQRLYAIFTKSSSNSGTSHTRTETTCTSPQSAFTSNNKSHADQYLSLLLNQSKGETTRRRSSLPDLPTDEEAARQELQELLVEQAARIIVGVSTIEKAFARSSTTGVPVQNKHANAVGYSLYW